MKLKALFLALAVAGAGASLALADDSGALDDHGHERHDGLDDHERRLSPDPPSGTLASVSASSFSSHRQGQGHSAVKSWPAQP